MVSGHKRVCSIILLLLGECVHKPDCRCTVSVTLADGSIALEEKEPGEVWQDECNEWWDYQIFFLCTLGIECITHTVLYTYIHTCLTFSLLWQSIQPPITKEIIVRVWYPDICDCLLYSACVDGKASCGTETCEHWSEWGPFSECDVSCGDDGVRTSVRLCVGQDDLDNFDGCPGVDTRAMNCTLDPCQGRSKFRSYFYGSKAAR